MPVVSVRIPQLGEGLQEALLVEFLKKPGDAVKRDEYIYVMETDKATSEVECPYEGTLVEWVVKEGQVLEIGTEIAKMEVAEGVKEMSAGHELPGHGQVASSSSDNGDESNAATATTVKADPRRTKSKVNIPPRTRKYLKEKGLLDVADQIPTAGSKLMPEDVDRYLETGGAAAPAAVPAAPVAAEPQSTDDYDEVELPRGQQTLNYRLTRGSAVCVPVNVMTDVDWTKMSAARAKAKAEGGPSAFSMMLWCVTRALARHSKFRSSISNDGRILRTYHHVKLGIAVARPGDELVTAVIENADQIPPSEFFQRVADQVEKARDGDDQADASTTISVSNIGTAGMKVGIPAIVAPAVATLALGYTFDMPVPDEENGYRFQKTATLSLTFDHRVINGIGGADFLNDVKKEIETYEYV